MVDSNPLHTFIKNTKKILHFKSIKAQNGTI